MLGPTAAAWARETVGRDFDLSDQYEGLHRTRLRAMV
jgi:hypothetical protein